MDKLEFSLGVNIRQKVQFVKDTIQKSLDDASGLDEWSVNVSYDIHCEAQREIEDCFTVSITFYENGVNNQKGTFKFTSLEAIFLTKICEIIYQIILNPEISEEIIEKSNILIGFNL